jgi:hypothetical protein
MCGVKMCGNESTIILLFIFGQTKICHGKDKNKNTPNVTHNYVSLVVGKGSL